MAEDLRVSARLNPFMLPFSSSLLLLWVEPRLLWLKGKVFDNTFLVEIDRVTKRESSRGNFERLEVRLPFLMLIFVYVLHVLVGRICVTV